MTGSVTGSVTGTAKTREPRRSMGTTWRVGREPALATIVPGLVFVIAIAVYTNSLSNGFAVDDGGILLRNATVHTLDGIWRAFTLPYWPNGAGQYRPLVVASFSAEWGVWGGNAAAFHALNVLWHGAASLLVYAFARRWLSFGGSAIAALLFAVHPVHVEAVSNVVGRAELMATCGVLGMLLLHARRSPWAVVAFAGALLSKEHAIVAPLLAAGLDLIERRPATQLSVPREEREPSRRMLPLYAGYGLVALVWVAALVVIFHDRRFASVDPFWSSMDAPARWLTMLGVVPVWLRLWFFPLDLSADYSPQVTRAWPADLSLALLGAIMVLVALVLALALRRRATPALVAIGWIGVTMLPVANILVPTGVIVAERTLYLSSVGAVMLAGMGAEWLARRRTGFALALVGLLAAAGAARTWTRTKVWESNRSLFLTTAADYPTASWTHTMLGRIYVRNGEFSRGVDEYRKALALFDRNSFVWSEAIYAAAQAREMLLADSLVVEAERRTQNDYLVTVAHAFVAIEQHRYSESLRVARRILAVAPDSAAGLWYAGKAWAALGEVDSARRALGRIPAGHPLRLIADTLLSALPPPFR